MSDEIPEGEMLEETASHLSVDSSTLAMFADMKKETETLRETVAALIARDERKRQDKLIKKARKADKKARETARL